MRRHRVKALSQSVVVQASLGKGGAEKHEWDADCTAEAGMNGMQNREGRTLQMRNLQVAHLNFCIVKNTYDFSC